MPDENGHPLCFSRGRNFVREPRLAYAGLTGNQEQAPAPGSRIVESAQQRGQFAVASNHRTRRPRSKFPASACPCYLNLADETITLAGYCGDESRRIGVVAQCMPDLPYRGIDSVVRIQEDALAPYPLQDFLARHELSAPVSKYEE